MSRLSQHIDFVNSQLTYHRRQIERLSKKESDQEIRRRANHQAVVKSLEELHHFLSHDSEQLSERNNMDEVSDSIHILPSDLNGLPDELLRELNITDSDKQELKIIDCLEKAGGTLSIDKLMILIYKETGEILKRKPLAAKLYRMCSKGLLRSSDKRGTYELVNKKSDSDDNNALDEANI